MKFKRKMVVLGLIVETSKMHILDTNAIHRNNVITLDSFDSNQLLSIKLARKITIIPEYEILEPLIVSNSSEKKINVYYDYNTCFSTNYQHFQ